ncbi:MAG: PEGA domain-containing protein [Spirochaetaceae bacterium]|jgi:TolB-like protein|nr:PEGA domain-containing protein [Spirochaetaceae bacterium]
MTRDNYRDSHSPIFNVPGSYTPCPRGIHYLWTMFLLVFVLSCSRNPIAYPKEGKSIIVFLVENQSDRRKRVVRRTNYNHSLIFSSRSYVLRPGECKVMFDVIPPGASVELKGVTQQIEAITGGIEPDTIVLVDKKFVFTENFQWEIEDLPIQDKQLASETLLDTFGFQEWGGRERINFYPYVPRRFQMNLIPYRVDPQIPLDLYVDGILWGETPLDVQLAPGRHHLQFSKDDLELYTTFIDLQEKGEFNRDLSSYERALIGDKIWTLVLGDFENAGDPLWDYLAPQLSEIIGEALGHSPRIQIEYTQGNSRQIALDRGAEMLLQGLYTEDSENLMLHVTLVDLLNDQSLRSDFYTMELGLDIFDAMERAASQIAQSVQLELPALEQQYYPPPDHYSEELALVEKAMALEQRSRLYGEHPHSLNFALGIPGTIFSSQETGSASSILATEFAYDRILLTYLRLGASYSLHVFPDLERGISQAVNMEVIQLSPQSDKREPFLGLGLQLQEFPLYGELISVDNVYSLTPYILLGRRQYKEESLSSARRFVEPRLCIYLPAAFLGGDDSAERAEWMGFYIRWGRQF